MTGIRKEFVDKHIGRYLSDTGTDLDDFKWEEYQQWLESELLKAQEHIDNLEFLLKQKNDMISQLETKATAYDRISTWHDDLPKNDGRYICVIGDGGYPVICAKKFENGRWLLGEREKIKWAYLPDGWEETNE